MISFETEQTNDLLFTEKLCWSFLDEAVNIASRPMHQPVIASVKKEIAVMRIVVLRRVDVDAKKIYFHTDIRSEKITDIKLVGKLSWLAYDPAYRTQIRLSGNSFIHHKDEIATQHWLKTPHYSRRCYLQNSSPGSVLTINEATNHLHTNFKYSMDESEAGFENFAVIETQVNWMEWYYTHSTGNRRAIFLYDESKLKDQYWIAP